MKAVRGKSIGIWLVLLLATFDGHTQNRTPVPTPSQPVLPPPPPKSDAVKAIEGARDLHTLNPCNATPPPAWCKK
jgi:hypothetical protein